ncbi:MAG: hypothetical protein Q9169_005965 [Polycauliona sp. 2 TL-2023]
MTWVPSLKRQRSESPRTSNPPPLDTIHPNSASLLTSTELSAAPESIRSIAPHQSSPHLPLQSTASDQSASSLPRSPVHSALPAAQSSPTEPLTHANLKQLTQDLIPPSERLPSSTKSRTESMPPSQGTASTDPAIVWTHLRRNHIFYETSAGAEHGARLIQKAKEIINQPRHSVMSLEEQTSVKDTIKSSKFIGETTCFIETVHVLIRDSRDKLVDAQAQEWASSAFKKDGLAKGWQTQFNSKAIPQLDDKDDFFKTVPLVKTPYPDLLFAYSGDYLDQSFVEILDAFEPFLVKQLQLPFLSLDGKGVLHGIEEAETQCARAGSSMVSHLIEFLNFLSDKLAEAKKLHQNAAAPLSSATTPQPVAAPGSDSGPQVDLPVMAFTAAFSPSVIHLFVHFAAISKDQPTCYHMHDLGSYDCKKEEDIALLRKHINNILDYGLGPRMTELGRRCQVLSESIRLAKKRKA